MKTQSRIALLTTVALGTIFAVLSGGCGSATSGSSTEDSSTSGTVAAMVGGAYSGSSGNGSLSFNQEPALKRPMQLMDYLKMGLPVADAMAASSCPTVASSASGGCAQGSGSVTMTYSDCSFKGSAATWSGSQIITASGIACGTSLPTSGTITRTFGSGTTRTAASGTAVQVDTAGNLIMVKGSTAGKAADGNTYTGGTTVTLAGGARTQVAVTGINYIGTNAAGKETFSHSLSTTTPLSINNGAVSGTVQLIHNLVKVSAVATLNGVTFTDGCCQPTGGSITTTFTALPNAGVVAQLFLAGGLSETLTFTGCGTATYTGPEGYTGNVTLAHCL